MHRLLVTTIADEACKSPIANRARFVVSMVVLIMVLIIFLSSDDFLTDLAVELSIGFGVELFERKLLPSFWVAWISRADALEMSFKFRCIRESQMALLAVDWRSHIVSSIEMVVQRVDGGVEDVRAGVFVRAWNFMLHVN